MSSLYTLRKALGGTHAVLNGKAFIIKKRKIKDTDKEFADFIDVATSQSIWYTSNIIGIDYTVDGVKILTKNTLYDLQDLQFILPTASSKIIVDTNLEEAHLAPLEEVKSTVLSRKHIHYGDGNVRYQIEFNRPTIEEEIRQFYKEAGLVYKTQEQAAWYEDYIDLEEVPNTNKSIWIITHWDRYTD